jgi:molecular chaperone DnaJ
LSKRDYYEVLGVSRDVDELSLKKSYRKVAMENHPDRNPGDKAAEERFKEASEAYAVLSDAEKRRAYDRFGHQGVGMGGAPGGFGSGPDFGDLGNFTDLFNDLFGDLFGGPRSGQRRRGGRGQRGADLRYNLEIELADALEGIDPSIQIPKMRACGTCDGSGARPGTRPESCGRCGGAGQVVLQQGFFRISRPCEACMGAGEIVRERCSECRGAGRVEGMQSIRVKVPAGIDDGMRLRLSGEGEAGIAGGPPGDLFVVITFKSHLFFEREGPDVHCQVPISVVQATLGDEIEVPTLEGKVNLKVPEGTQTGKVLRLRGKGLPTIRTANRGDQLIHIFVETPTRLSKRQRELFKEFAAESGEEVSPVTRGFLEKLKDLFE